MLEKGFWFKQPTDNSLIEKVKMVLHESGIGYYPQITASIIEPADAKDYLRLADVLVARQLLPDHYITRIFTTLISCSQFLFRDTYERSSPSSFLTREDLLVIASELEEIPIHLSTAHTFIELKEGSYFEWAADILASYGIETDQPRPLPLKNKAEDKTEPIRYFSKYDMFSYSAEAKKKRGYDMPHNDQKEANNG